MSQQLNRDGGIDLVPKQDAPDRAELERRAAEAFRAGAGAAYKPFSGPATLREALAQVVEGLDKLLTFWAVPNCAPSQSDLPAQVEVLKARLRTEMEVEELDFYAMGYDAALSGHSDIPPSEVSQYGPDAEAAWQDGYNAFHDEQEEGSLE